MRVRRLAASFVEKIPAQLDAGILYISLAYRTASHLCACGCGRRIATPIRPSPHGWTIEYNGENVSLHPSVGLSELPCNSHYIVDQGRVVWLPAEGSPVYHRFAITTLGANRRRLLSTPSDPRPERETSWWRRRHREPPTAQAEDSAKTGTPTGSADRKRTPSCRHIDQVGTSGRTGHEEQRGAARDAGVQEGG